MKLTKSLPGIMIALLILPLVSVFAEEPTNTDSVLDIARQKYRNTQITPAPAAPAATATPIANNRTDVQVDVNVDVNVNGNRVAKATPVPSTPDSIDNMDNAETQETLEYVPFGIQLVPAIPFNFADNRVGFSISPLVLLTGATESASISGIVNITRTNAAFLQLAGIVNTAGSVNGAQIAGNVNVSGNVTGFQLSGTVNIAADVNGGQVGGIINIAHDITGGQVGGIVNIANDINGGQVGGIVNIANKVHGFQIGLINISDDIDGLCIGLLNLSRNGINESIATWDSSGLLSMGYQFGTRNSYTVVTVGEKIDDLMHNVDSMVFSVGAGLRFGEEIGPYFQGDLSYKGLIGFNGSQNVTSVNHVGQDGWSLTSNSGTGNKKLLNITAFNAFPSIRLAAGFHFTKRFGVMAGLEADIATNNNLVPGYFNYNEDWNGDVTLFGQKFVAYTKWFVGLTF